MSQHVGRVADELRLAGDNLVDANQGAAFEKGKEQLNRIASVADAFSHNAHVMAEATGRLFGVHAYGSNIVHVAQTGLAALPPAERVAAEQAFLHAFPAEFQPAVTAAIPQISQLTTPVEAHQPTDITTGIDEHTQAFTHHQTTPAGWNAAAGLSAVAGPATGSSHYAASQHAGQPTGHPGHTPTTPAAHLPAGTSPPPAAAPTHVGRTQPAGLWASPRNPTTAPQPTRGPVPAAGRGGSGHVLGTTRTTGGPLGSTPGRSLLSSGQLATGTGQVHAPATPAIGASPRAGQSPTPGHHLAGGHTPHTGGVGGHPPAGSTAHSAGGPPAHQKTTGTARPVAAMPPMTPAAQQNGRHKPVKTMTTAVESDANTQAIFGNRRPALPGVIGEWTKH